ncbi:inositol 2-dehydrogenase [Bacillaceae bacterium Marseille-Q3522]|nr:inositol 2-dehydrogenase [Bacillaceae bacterium Marseille-Q3522]
MVRLKIGIIGTGRIGKLHIANLTALTKEFEIKAISDPFDKNLNELARDYNIPQTYKNYKDLIDKNDIQAVVIASSTDTHAEIITYAAKKGKDIFCEKPLDTNIERIKELIKIVEESKIKFQLGFNRRFDHNFRRVKEYVKDGNVGTPNIIKITSRDPEPPPLKYIKVSGGLFMDMMIHDFDMARYLSGSEVVEVFASGAVLAEPTIGEAGDIDTAIVNLKFANGALGVIDNSRQAVYGYDQRVEVFGTKGQAVAYNDRPTTVELDTQSGSYLDKIPFFFIDRYEQAYKDQFKEFYNCLTNHCIPEVSAIDGLKSVELAQAAAKSLREGRSVRL